MPERSRSKERTSSIPRGEGRPFKEWVVVPAAHADEWEAFSHEALKPAG